MELRRFLCAAMTGGGGVRFEWPRWCWVHTRGTRTSGNPLLNPRYVSTLDEGVPYYLYTVIVRVRFSFLFMEGVCGGIGRDWQGGGHWLLGPRAGRTWSTTAAVSLYVSVKGALDALDG